MRRNRPPDENHQTRLRARCVTLNQGETNLENARNLFRHTEPTLKEEFSKHTPLLPLASTPR